MSRVIIIGGGISGLSAAYYLSKAGIRPTVVERDGRLGGVIKTQRLHGCLIEGGPDSFLAAKPQAIRPAEAASSSASPPGPAMKKLVPEGLFRNWPGERIAVR